MVGYRCYILDDDDHIVQAHDLHCATDQEAKATAEGFLERDPYYRFVEVWQATRRVLKLERGKILPRPTTPSPPDAGRPVRPTP